MAAFRAVCAALVLVLLAPAAQARSPATVTRAGADPDVAADDAGTGHFVWSTTRGSLTTTHYCRIRRTKHACTPGSERRFRPGPRAPRAGGNRDFQGPRVFLNGATVVVVTDRCCGVPGAGDEFEATFRFVSTDGGRTFDRGKLIGSAEIENAVLGPGDAITVIASGDGARVQTAPLAGPATDAQAVLLPDIFVSHVAVGLAGAQLVAGVSDGEKAFTARLVGANPNDAGAWQTQPDGSFAELYAMSGGPAGLFELAATAADQIGWRPYDPATGLFGPSRPVSPENAIFGAGVQDAGGRLHASWQRFGALRYRRSVPGGGSFGPTQRLVPRGGGFFDPAIGAGTSGLGWVAWDANSDDGRIRAIAVP